MAVTKAAAARAATKAAHATRAASGNKRQSSVASGNGASTQKRNGNVSGTNAKGDGITAGVTEGVRGSKGADAVTADDLEGLSQIEEQLLSGESESLCNCSFL